MQDIVNKLLGDHAGEWISKLTGKLGFSAEAAGKFVPGLIEKVTGLVGEGKLDPRAILSDLNPSELAARAGIDPVQAKEGAEALVPDMLDKAKDALGVDADGLLAKGKDMLGGLGKGLLGG